MSDNKYKQNQKDAENQRIRKELQQRYKRQWGYCKQVFPPTNSIEEYLGELDADVEWSIDERGAFKRFLNIDAYKRFIEEDNLILMGRTGTGKSSILNRYVYAVNSGEIKGFSVALYIKLEKFFDIMQEFTFDTQYKPVSYITKGTELVIKLCIMFELVRMLNSREDDNNTFSNEIQQLYQFL